MKLRIRIIFISVRNSSLVVQLCSQTGVWKRDKRNSSIFNFLFAILIFLFSSCNNKSQEVNSAFKLKDDVNIEISFESYPRRIISLAPNITEGLFAIGADSLIVGITDFCSYPPDAKSKTKTGSYLNPNYEIIASLNADLIIMNVETTSNPTYQALKNLGMKIYVSNAKNINDILKMLKDFGRITGKVNKSSEVVEKISKERENYIASNKNVQKKKCFVIISVNPLMTANGNTFISEIAELSGFENIYKDQKIDYPLISYEDVTSMNPPYIILPTDTNNVNNNNKYLDEISNQLNTTDAVKDKKIILVDENIMFRPGPRVLEGVKLLRIKLQNF